MVWIAGLFSLAVSFGLAWVYAAILYWADRHEKEPKRLLLQMFLWGAFVATFGAALFSSAVDAGLQWAIALPPATYDWLSAVVTAPLVEESFKAGALVLLMLLWRDEIDSVFDGVIYGALVGLGFEALENTLYLLGSLDEGGLGQWFLVGVLRLGLFGFSHAFYTSLTGAGLALWRLYSRKWWAWFMPLVGWSGAVLAHAIHNASVTAGALPCLLGAGFHWLGLASLVGVLIWSLKREAGWLRRYLRAEAEAGRISVAHYRTALSWSRRMRAIRQARKRGKSHARNTREFYRLLADLAFVLAHIHRGHNELRYRQRAEELRQRIHALAAHAETG